MYQTSIASSQDHEKVLAFLEKQGLVENVWLIQDVSNALLYNSDWNSVMICRFYDEIIGVAHVLDWRKIPPSPSGYKPKFDYEVRMDAVDRKTLETLIEAFPTDLVGEFRVFRPMIQKYFQELPDAKCMGVDGGLYFTISPERFQPVIGENVIELTANDAGLFEGCEEQRSWEYRAEEDKVFAIVYNDRAVTSVGIGAITPKTGTKHRVIAIGGLYTETKYRRMGLGKRLVSHVTEIILQDGNVPIYWTEPENIASQSLARSLGYWQIVGQTITYRWRKKE